MVYYRKYRPQTIGELDSSKLRETLTAVLSRPDVPHAFLLTGPKGLGKTSTARIIAKVVNCEHTGQSSVSSLESLAKDQRPMTSDQIEPDNTCEQCVSITNGSNMDVLEIDGASNRGIDEIRDLRDKVKLAPSRAKKKVYIIDEVHMLTTEAFNALLKTIEEPPAHVMFIFCTTEPQKVPATILSRCFHVPYSLATEDDLVRSFKRIVEGEKLTIDDEALHMIARLADGGFRDGTKILEEIVLLANGEKITKEFIEKHYQVANAGALVKEFKVALFGKQVKEALEIVSKAITLGIDIKYFLTKFLEELQKDLLMQVGLGQQPDEQARFSLVDIQLLTPLFSEAYKEAKYAVIPQLPLELAVIAWCSQGESLESDSGQARMTVQKVMEPNKHTMDTLLRKEKNLKVQSLLRGTPPVKEVKKLETGSSQEKLSDKAAGEQFLGNLIYKIKPINFSVAGVLRGCIIKKLADGEVIFETSYKFHKEKLDEVKTKELLEKSVKEITGKNLKVVVELTNKGNI